MHFKARVREWATRIRVTPQQVRVQAMRRKWASCWSRGWLTFARDLLGESHGFQDRVIVEPLVYGVLVTFVVSRPLLPAALRGRLHARGARVSDERWAALFAEVPGDLLKAVPPRAPAACALAREVRDILLHEAVDPNTSRAFLQARVEAGVQHQHWISVAKGHA